MTGFYVKYRLPLRGRYDGLPLRGRFDGLQISIVLKQRRCLTTEYLSDIVKNMTGSMSSIVSRFGDDTMGNLHRPKTETMLDN
jgi:hypothetical protein